jgi:uncharacterized protein (TIGR02757 family)
VAASLSRDGLRTLLESVYADCHDPSLIDPDPLLVVREYPDPRDREIVALFCACMALGRASAIVGACRKALAPFGPRPRAALSRIGFPQASGLLSGFKYRFFDASDAASLLLGAVALAEKAGSLEAFFLSAPSVSPSGYPPDEPSRHLLDRCDAFVDGVRAAAASSGGGAALPVNLLPAPRDGSACKRLMLFLRWMVRRDDVDPGGWTRVSPSELVLPLDVHLHRISSVLGMTSRRSADLRAALEVTAVLRAIDPADPVRFDFSLARLGIRSDYSLNSFLRA